MQYLRARYYDPSTGQFLSRDPIEDQTLQPYAYAGNDPTNAIDPTGLSFLSTAGGLIDSVTPDLMSDIAAIAVNFLTNGAAGDIACNGLTAENGLNGGLNIAMTFVPGGKIAQLGKRLAARGMRSAYDVAVAGGKHAGFLKNYEGRSHPEIERGIASAREADRKA